LRAQFSGAALEAILASYLSGLHAAYAIAIACAGLAAFVGLAAEWKKINVEEIMAKQALPKNEAESVASVEEMETAGPDVASSNAKVDS
jgi:hypothetical protein